MEAYLHPDEPTIKQTPSTHMALSELNIDFDLKRTLSQCERDLTAIGTIDGKVEVSGGSGEPRGRPVFRQLIKHAKDPLSMTMIIAVIFLVFTFVAAAIISSVNANKIEVKTHMTPGQLEQLGGEPAVLIKPWEPANPQWFYAVVAMSMLILRKYILPVVTRQFYGHLPENKQTKVANYMLELIGTTFALTIASLMGQWTLIFSSSQYLPHPSIAQGYDLALGMHIMYVCTLSMYQAELAFDHEIRFGLAIHHWTAMVISSWGVAAVSLSGNDVLIVRMLFAFSLYMSTEQNVFLEMLAYQRKIYWPRVYWFSAWYYLLTRICILSISMWTWWDCYDSVFSDSRHNSVVVYAFWLFVPMTNIILNITQLTTVQSLFGIARTVRQRASEIQEDLNIDLETAVKYPDSPQAKAMQETRIVHKLRQFFAEIDFDQIGSISKTSWIRHAEAMDLELTVPHWAFKELFDAMDANSDNQLTCDEFVAYLKPFAMESVDIRLTLLAVLLKSITEANVHESFKTMAQNRLAAVKAQMHLQYRLRRGNVASPKSWKMLGFVPSLSKFQASRSCPAEVASCQLEGIGGNALAKRYNESLV
jgi:Ca2+-binding EF-hand superfamily protein